MSTPYTYRSSVTRALIFRASINKVFLGRCQRGSVRWSVMHVMRLGRAADPRPKDVIRWYDSAPSVRLRASITSVSIDYEVSRTYRL